MRHGAQGGVRADGTRQSGGREWPLTSASAPYPVRRQPPGESDMAVSDALLPSFSTFASGPAGREKTLRPAGAPNNVSVGPGLWGPPVGFCGWDGDGRSPGVNDGQEWPRTGSSAGYPGWLPRPWLICTCVWSRRGGTAGGARRVRTRPGARERQGGRAGHRAGGVCVPRHWLGQSELGA